MKKRVAVLRRALFLFEIGGEGFFWHITKFKQKHEMGTSTKGGNSMMQNALLKKFREALFSILPIVLIVLILAVTLVPLDFVLVVQFLVAAIFLVFGMTLFTHGADTAMLPIGQHIGAYLSQSAKIWLMMIVGFFLGIVITVAEPDLMVLAEQVASINTWLFIAVVGIGVGLFMMLAMLRTVLKIPLNIILAVSYGVIFVLSFIIPNNFVPLSFDSGSVTTGPISVPFLMAFGLGFAAVRAQSGRQDDSSFGMVALGSAGPILAVMILGLFVDPSTLAGSTESAVVCDTVGAGLLQFLTSLPTYIGQVALVIVPILVIFLIFQFAALKLSKREVLRIIMGIVFVFVGITLFFTGVNVGFLPVGSALGNALADSSYSGVLIPIAIVIGFVIVLAEPAVHVLAEQVEKITEGKISKKTIFFSICIGVGVSLGLCALRVLCGFSIWWVLVPAYAIAIVLSFVVPPIFTGIAFDSGGVATGAMATTFVLPMFMGACGALGIDTMLYGFGTLAFIAVTPLLTIQILGLIVGIANRKKERAASEERSGTKRVEIIDFD